MDSFDNFQYDSASSYGGGIGIVDDNSSVYTATTHDVTSSNLNLSSLSLSEYGSSADNIQAAGSSRDRAAVLDEDIYGVLDDLKDESAVDLPSHACR